MFVRLLHVAFLAVRPWFWFAALGPAYAGYIYNHGELGNLLQCFILTVVVGLCIAGLSEVSNEIFDYKLDTTSREVKVWGVNSSGNTGLVQRFRIQPKTLFLLLPVLMALGISLTEIFAPQAVGLVVFGMSLGVFYSAPPIRLKANPIGNWVSKCLGYGPIAFFIGASFSSPIVGLPLDLILIGIAFGLIAAGYICIADLADYEIDFLNGIRTIPVVLGQRRAAAFFVGSIFLGHIFLVLTALFVSVRAIILALALFSISVVLSYQTLRQFQNIETISKIHLLGGQIMMWSPIISAFSLSTV
jgi:4-hydroxybenzoate polyprenyltransferase